MSPEHWHRIPAFGDRNDPVSEAAASLEALGVDLVRLESSSGLHGLALPARALRAGDVELELDDGSEPPGDGDDGLVVATAQAAGSPLRELLSTSADLLGRPVGWLALAAPDRVLTEEPTLARAGRLRLPRPDGGRTESLDLYRIAQKKAATIRPLGRRIPEGRDAPGARERWFEKRHGGTEG